jgi:hypothetical protein
MKDKDISMLVKADKALFFTTERMRVHSLNYLYDKYIVHKNKDSKNRDSTVGIIYNNKAGKQ